MSVLHLPLSEDYHLPSTTRNQNGESLSTLPTKPPEWKITFFVRMGTFELGCVLVSLFMLIISWKHKTCTAGSRIYLETIDLGLCSQYFAKK